jgi:hypothetical protein
LQQTGLSVAPLPLAPAAERRYVGRPHVLLPAGLSGIVSVDGGHSWWAYRRDSLRVSGSSRRRLRVPGELRHGLFLKVFGWATAAATLGLGYIILFTNHRGQYGVLTLLIVVFGAGAGYLLLEAHGTAGTFDAQRISIRTAWTGRKNQHWEDLPAVSFRPNLNWYVLAFKDGTIIRLSNVVLGHAQPWRRPDDIWHARLTKRTKRPEALAWPSYPTEVSSDVFAPFPPRSCGCVAAPKSRRTDGQRFSDWSLVLLRIYREKGLAAPPFDWTRWKRGGTTRILRR